jgi:hypothetical protein
VWDRDRNADAATGLFHPHPIPLPPSLAMTDPYLHIAESAAPNLIPAAFKCVQLIADDLMPLLPPHGLSAFMVCLSLFSKQVVDVNASLTAVGVLWVVADMIGSADEQFAEGGADGGGAGGGGGGGGGGAGVDDGGRRSITPASVIGSEGGADALEVGALWMRLVIQLRFLLCGGLPASGSTHPHAFSASTAPLSAVPRDRLEPDAGVHPDVRNSAAQTLFSSFAAHGEALPERLWHDVLVHELLPLVDAVAQFARAAAKDATVMEGEEIGRARGGTSVRMVLHHSRNTLAKQWNEVRVVTLHGLTRVLSAGFLRFRRVAWFRDAWLSCLGQLETGVTGLAPTPSPALVLLADEDDRTAHQMSTVLPEAPQPPLHKEPTAVGIAALQALQEIALLVCVPAGAARTVGKHHISIGMKVVNGALTMVDGRGGDGGAPVAPRRRHVHRRGATGEGKDAAPSARTTHVGSASVGDEGPHSVSRTQMWREIVGVLRTISRCATVLSDPEEVVAMALLEVCQGLLESACDPESSHAKLKAGSRSLLASRRAGVMLRVRAAVVSLQSLQSCRPHCPALWLLCATLALCSVSPCVFSCRGTCVSPACVLATLRRLSRRC